MACSDHGTISTTTPGGILAMDSLKRSKARLGAAKLSTTSLLMLGRCCQAVEWWWGGGMKGAKGQEEERKGKGKGLLNRQLERG